VFSDEMRPGVVQAAFNHPASMANSVVSAVPGPVNGNHRFKLGRGVLRKMASAPTSATSLRCP
jgi:arsenite oxidase large subunit